MNDQLKRVEDLKVQLRSLGYNSFQIDQIVRDTVSPTNLSQITDEQAQEIVDALTEYVQFAQKCRKGCLRR